MKGSNEEGPILEIGGTPVVPVSRFDFDPAWPPERIMGGTLRSVPLTGQIGSHPIRKCIELADMGAHPGETDHFWALRCYMRPEVAARVEVGARMILDLGARLPRDPLERFTWPGPSGFIGIDLLVERVHIGDVNAKGDSEVFLNLVGAIKLRPFLTE